MNKVKALVLFAVVSVAVVLASGQSTAPRRLITESIDNTRTVVLRGNTHPLAQPQSDRGPAPASLPMEKMILVLKTPTERAYALDELLSEQQDRSSPNYRQWITPEQFGAQFGASDADINAIKSWLVSEGFTIDYTAKGHNILEFSGTAANIQSAFHTSIHKYELGNKSYWANEADPSIPEALAPGIVGVASMNNFPRPPAHRVLDAGLRARRAAMVKHRASSGTKPKPQFTYECSSDPTAITCYAVNPYDLATIYNILPLWNSGINGTGQTIAIVADSDINMADFTNFRSLFGLPTGTLNVIHNGTDPGILGGPSCSTDDCNESEVDVDTEWSGAVAPNATIDLVVSASTNTSFGGDLSAEYIIDNQSSLKATALGYSYGSCEFFLGQTGNAFYGGSPVTKDSVGEWQQAASEGITVSVSTGDNGSTGCDNPGNGTTGAGAICPAANPGSSTVPPYNDPAECGLAVNGIASTPYNVAVGGTDFDDGCESTPCPASNPVTNYWNASNAATTNASVIGYIPEIAYNDSCVNVPLDLLDTNGTASTSAETNCNDFVNDTGTPFLASLVVPFGGGGGVSNCTTVSDTATNPNQCTGGYPAPTWQTGAPASATNRELPDVSMFAGDGSYENFYLYCEQDLDITTSTACNLTEDSSDTSDLYPNIQGVGGTSVSAEVFVGLVALLNQKEGSAVGLPNGQLYSLAGQSWAMCNSNGSTNSPTTNSACIFNQVTSTSATNAQPCANGTLNCSTTASAVPPDMRPNRPGILSRWWTPVLVGVGSLLSLLMMFLVLRRRNRWWAVAAASVIFFAFIALAACGGGGGGSSSSAPIITTQPANQTVASGATATFSVSASGSSPLAYQWSENGANISGATSSSYTTPAATCAVNGAQFVVAVSNSAGSATSNAATLTVSGCGATAAVGISSENGTNESYKAATGYNMATGLGSLNAYNLINEWNVNSSSDFVLSANPAAVTTSGGNATTTITVTAVGSFSGSVTFAATGACSGLPSGASCSPSPTSVQAGQTTTLSISAPTSPGQQAVPIIVSGTAGSETRTTVIWLTVP